jgi:hypothetical protein
MRRAFASTLALLLVSLPLALAGCQRSETPAAPGVDSPPPAAAPFRVTSVELGSAIGADKRIAAPTTRFAPTDTIYASVLSEGSAGSVTLTARWTYEDGQTVTESTETIAPTGAAATEFHIARPSGWPAGRYRVEITANGAPAGAREFEVR